MHVDLVIVGSGFGGAILAMVARRLGKSVLLLERGSHPRFAIGESTSPLMNLLIEELAHTYDLPRLLPLATYGTWKAHYPELGVGLKRGFTYYGTQPGERLLVAASPGDPCADTHWLRADVDHFLVKEAIALGVEYRDNVDLAQLERTENGWRTRDHGDEADFLIDASGPKGFLHRRQGWKEVGFCGYPNTQSLFSHFVGVKPANLLPPSRSRRGSRAKARGEVYPPDAAASHYIFPGGWMWILPFDSGVTSAGFSVEDGLAGALGLSEGNAAAWERFLARFPAIQAQFGDAQPIEKWHYSPKLSFRTEHVVGEGFALLPSAVGFIDPLYSTGMPLTLLGIQRLAKLLEQGITPEGLASYEATTFAELDWVAAFIAANYAAFADFPRFVDTTMFYFAAASFSELARRIGKPELAQGYLLTKNAAFRESFAAWQENKLSLAEAIAPWNVAGLADPGKHDLYGVDLEDVVRGGAKLGKTEAELREVIATAEWARCE
jgi:FADH2 O2-dependent halogenase